MLRTFSNQFNISRIIQLIQYYQSYRRQHPSTRGFLRLIRKTVGALQQGGLNTLYQTIRYSRNAQATAALALINSSMSMDNMLILDGRMSEQNELAMDVAVHAHILDTEFSDKLSVYLENMPVKFHLYVTTDTQEKANSIKHIFEKVPNVLSFDLVISNSHGKSIYPVLVTLRDRLAQHDIVLQIHTKCPQLSPLLLTGWRRYMMESLLGNPQRVTQILQQFIQNKELGILFPVPSQPIKQFIPPRIDANSNIKKSLKFASIDYNKLDMLDTSFFPPESMFWFRGKALQSFIKMGLSEKDFKPENSAIDESVVDTLEGMLPYFAYDIGLVSRYFFPISFLSPQCKAHQIILFTHYIEKNWVKNPILLFDHNGGGGTNTYSNEFIKNELNNGFSVIRIYNSDGIWFVQWTGDNDGMLFYTPYIDELFDALSKSQSTKIIANSFYGHPDIKLTIEKVIKLTQSSCASLDIKFHDFYALCPSPHLLNFKSKYCGIPSEVNTCKRCLSKNRDFYHHWYPEENYARDIMEWRQPFAELLAAATSISFFDPSSIDIVRRAFELEDSKINVIPHDDTYFAPEQKIELNGPLHIGILGVMSKGKGADIINSLCQHIKNQKIGTPITLVGSSSTYLAREIMVHGHYAPSDLPKIINQKGINVILMPAIVPETFSYTLSEAMKMRLPIVAFDIGAQGNRVKQYELGAVVPIGSSSEEILEALISVLKFTQEQDI